MSDEQKKVPTEAELAEMSRDEKVRLGTELDDVDLVEYQDRFPVDGTRAEKRAERSIAMWFVISALSTVSFIGVFLFWPYRYVDPLSDPQGYAVYSLYTPLVGFFFGLSILAVGIAVVMYTKKFIPHEVAVQQRHDGHGSSEVDRQTTTALLADAGDRSGIARRSLIKRSAGFGLGAFGLGAGLLSIGGFVRNPWADEGADSLQHTDWMKRYQGEKIYLRRSTGHPHEVSLVRPEDIDAGGFETVYPFRESDRQDDDELAKALKSGDSAVMLIRLRPGSSPQKRDRKSVV